MNQKIASTNVIDANYCSFWVVWFLQSFCCCCISTCRRSKSCDRRLTKYLKFNLAYERLMKEHDINLMLKLNRVSILLHKLYLLPRQRRMVDMAQNFVISDADLGST